MFSRLEISASEAKRRLDAAEAALIDIREPDEYCICHIEGAPLIPMREVPMQLDRLELNPLPLVLFCHHGVRSLKVVEWLQAQGITDCLSMAGGIDAWSLEVDSTIPRY